MTWLWILDVKIFDDDCSFLYCTSVWSIPDSSRSEMNLRFKPKVSQMRKSWNISADQWPAKIPGYTKYMKHTESPQKVSAVKRASRGSSFLLHFKWSPWSTSDYTWCTSSKASSMSTWKLFTLPTQYHLSSVLVLHHFLVWLQTKYSNKWRCIYFYSDYISFYLWRFKSKDYVIALFMKSENLKEKTD